MMKLFSIPLCLAVSLLLGSVLSATEETEAPSHVLKPRFRVGVSTLHGISANFSNLAAVGFVNDPGPDTGGAEERFYNNGSNRVDTSGNVGEQTSYWSYENTTQYDGSNITFASEGVTDARGFCDGKDTPSGLEFGVDYPLGHARDFKCIQEWGLSFELHWHRIEIENRENVVGDSILVEDSFSTNGGFPPAAPYTGSFSGPGFLLDSIPNRNRTNQSGGISVIGSRSIDADLYSLNLGPYARIQLFENYFLNLSAGATVAYINSEYQLEGSTTVGGSITGTTRGRDTKGGYLAGGYGSVGIEYKMSKYSYLLLDVGCRFTENFDQNVGESQAELDFGSVLSVSFAYVFDF